MTWGTIALVLAWAVPAGASARQSAPAAASLLFDGVTVVDVEQGQLVPDQRVVIAGNRIEAVGGTDAIKLPKGAQVVDAKGKYVIPGLWDLHTHPFAKADLFYPLFIANGVTGTRNAWSPVPLKTQVQWWREILAGARVGPPRQLLAGAAFRAGSYPNHAPDSAVVERVIDSIKAQGANFLKLYPYTHTVAAAARRAGLPFGGHVTSPITTVQASDSGISVIDHTNTAGGLEHTCWGAGASLDACQPVAERLRQNGTWWVPTLIPFKGDKSRWGGGTRSQSIYDRFVAQVRTFWSGSMLVGNWLQDSAGKNEVLYLSRTDSLGYMHIMHRVGFPVLAGTDVWTGTAAGFTLHAEMAMYVAEGLTPLEALRAATLNPAKMLRGTDSLGTVAPGKLADLVLLDANPLADITNTTTIRAVVANGRYFDRASLDSLLAEVRTKGP